MNRNRIHDWEDIKKHFKHKLLLGNGASRAVWESFKYPSLYEEANRAGRIDQSLKNLFSDFGTNDFEYILRLLSQANQVNQILHIKEEHTSKLYKKLKKTLIDTIRDVHPKHEEVKNRLLPMAQFMKGFDTVLSLNYDLLVYWAMLEGNDKHGNWFKDGFIEGRFDNDYNGLYEPYLAEGATLVFYPHGNLIIATDHFGDEMKLSKSGQKYLIDTILRIWETGEHIPLFVSEGETNEKLKAIRRSNYLKTVYDRVIDSNSESLVAYGWSFRDEDEHILRGIIHGKVDRIAVSVHRSSGNVQPFCETVKYKIDKMYATLEKEREKDTGKKVKKTKRCTISFFDSESAGAWINSSKLEEVTL
jgi:hypothetical protein